MAGRGDEQPAKRRLIHLDVVESVRLSQSEEGSASLRLPIDRTHPAVNSNRGLDPRYRARTRRRFQPPRVVASLPLGEEAFASGSQEEQSADDRSLPAPGSGKGSCKSSPVLKSSQNDSDQFDSESDELEQEMVKQSSDNSIRLLTTLGGFTSAADVQQSSASCSFGSPANSPLKNNLGGAAWKMPQKKQWVKDANQSSITSFMSSSVTTSSSSSSTAASGSCSVHNDNVSHLSNDIRNNKSEPLSSYPKEKIVYGTPSKMYSPIKQVSDSVYVISDDSSPDSKRVKACSATSGRSSAHADLAKSVVKTLFAPPSTQTSSSVRSGTRTFSKRASGRGKKTSSTSSGRRSKPTAGTYGGKKAKPKDTNQRTFSSLSSTLSLVDMDFDEADDQDFLDLPASVPAVRQEVEVGRTYGLLNDSKVTVTRKDYFEKLPLDVIENIFCCLPMLDLCLNVNRVCLAWNDIISNPKVSSFNFKFIILIISDDFTCFQSCINTCLHLVWFAEH